METYSIVCGVVKDTKDAKNVITGHESRIKSPCYVNLLTDKVWKKYYAEKSNLAIQGAGWIVAERVGSVGKISK